MKKVMEKQVNQKTLDSFLLEKSQIHYSYIIYRECRSKTPLTRENMLIMILYKQKYQNYQVSLPADNGNDPLIKIDEKAAQFWYYAVTKQFREYQFKIVETCLFNNTMVCLPTGLGKTFIAAVTILNYYLWFPTGKIFFLAPTRPLVKQQIDSLKCFDGIDQRDLIDITGSIPPKKREELYKKKKIFFMTPQSLQNDLDEKRYSGSDVSLIVFDEAHHGTGKYSYTQIINFLEANGYGYRILALTATPGNDRDGINEVIQNMKVSRLEAFDDEDPDVKQYIHQKDVELVIIEQNFSLKTILEALNEVIQHPYDWLTKVQIIPPRIKKIIKSPSQINRGIFYQIFQHFTDSQNELREKLGPDNITIAYQKINILSHLTHGKKTLNDQSISCFKKWLQEFQEESKDEQKKGSKKQQKNLSKSDLIKGESFQNLIKVTFNLTDGEGEKQQHPKSSKLLEILTEYFADEGNIQKKSKVMIFTQNRNNVQDLYKFLSNHQEYVDMRPAIFVGQASSASDQGMNQKQQLENIQNFKNNVYNVLIATCIGEEGLDIGEIDLIICYDSGFSPIRMIQRMGRTGRQRQGKVKVLLMKGKEHNSYIQSQKTSKKLKQFLKKCAEYQKKKIEPGSTVAQGNYELGFYGFSPRMIPEHIQPKLQFIDNKQQNKSKYIKSASDLSDNNESSYSIIENEEISQSKQNQIQQEEEESLEIDKEVNKNLPYSVLSKRFDYDSDSESIQNFKQKLKNKRKSKSKSNLSQNSCSNSDIDISKEEEDKQIEKKAKKVKKTKKQNLVGKLKKKEMEAKLPKKVTKNKQQNNNNKMESENDQQSDQLNKSIGDLIDMSLKSKKDKNKIQFQEIQKNKKQSTSNKEQKISSNININRISRDIQQEGSQKNNPNQKLKVACDFIDDCIINVLNKSQNSLKQSQGDKRKEKQLDSQHIDDPLKYMSDSAIQLIESDSSVQEVKMEVVQLVQSQENKKKNPIIQEQEDDVYSIPSSSSSQIQIQEISSDPFDCNGKQEKFNQKSYQISDTDSDDDIDISQILGQISEEKIPQYLNRQINGDKNIDSINFEECDKLMFKNDYSNNNNNENNNNNTIVVSDFKNIKNNEDNLQQQKTPQKQKIIQEVTELSQQSSIIDSDLKRLLLQSTTDKKQQSASLQNQQKNNIFLNNDVQVNKQLYFNTNVQPISLQEQNYKKQTYICSDQEIYCLKNSNTNQNQEYQLGTEQQGYSKNTPKSSSSSFSLCPEDIDEIIQNATNQQNQLEQQQQGDAIINNQTNQQNISLSQNRKRKQDFNREFPNEPLNKQFINYI